MNTFYQNLVHNIIIAIEPFMNTNRAFVLPVLGLEYPGLRILAHILPGRKMALAYCRQEAGNGFSPLPFTINKRGVQADVR